MFLSKVTSSGVCFSGAAILYSFKCKLLAKDCHECNMKRLPKAKELPLYDTYAENHTIELDKKSKVPLTSEISAVRQQLSGVMSYLNVVKEEAVHIYETGVAHSQSTYDYIKSDENKIPRILVITSGGLVGILMARKRGYFKKAVYGSLGAGLVFSAFYPSLAKEYINSGFEYSKSHTADLLEKYGGYDTKKMAEEANAKVENLKNTLKLDGLTNNFNEWIHQKKEVISNSINNISKSSSESKEESSKTK